MQKGVKLLSAMVKGLVSLRQAKPPVDSSGGEEEGDLQASVKVDEPLTYDQFNEYTHILFTGSPVHGLGMCLSTLLTHYASELSPSEATSSTPVEASAEPAEDTAGR